VSADASSARVPAAALPTTPTQTVAEPSPTGLPEPVLATLAPDPARSVLAAIESERGTPGAQSGTAPRLATRPPAQPSPELTRQLQNAAQQLVAQRRQSARASYTIDGRPVSIWLERMPAEGDTGLEYVEARVVTDVDGQSVESRVQLRRLAFSHFTQLVDRWDTEVQLHDDEIDGRFHSNSEIVLGWSGKVAPRFRGPVTTSWYDYTVANASTRRSRAQIFAGGIETGARRVNMPRRAVRMDVRRFVGATDAQHHVFERATRVVLHADGSYDWRTDDGDDAAAGWTREPRRAGTLYLLGADGARIALSGTVRGRVLVYSPEQLTILDDVRYARDVRTQSEADDYLGLVSDGDVVIANSESTGPGDLHIDAAIFAHDRFIVRGSERSGPAPATLTVFGSLSAGSISATEPRYATRIDFDRRLETLRPPSFPMTDRFEAVRSPLADPVSASPPP
jgi:hypothetical protein